jgi:hypothetical protein
MNWDALGALAETGWRNRRRRDSDVPCDSGQAEYAGASLANVRIVCGPISKLE